MSAFDGHLLTLRQEDVPLETLPPIALFRARRPYYGNLTTFMFALGAVGFAAAWMVLIGTIEWRSPATWFFFLLSAVILFGIFSDRKEFVREVRIALAPIC